MFDLPLGRSASDPVSLGLPPQSYRLFLINHRVPLPDKPRLDGTQKRIAPQ